MDEKSYETPPPTRLVDMYAPLQGPLQEELLYPSPWQQDAGQPSIYNEPTLSQVPGLPLAPRGRRDLPSKKKVYLIVLLASMGLVVGLAASLLTSGAFFKPVAHSRTRTPTPVPASSAVLAPTPTMQLPTPTPTTSVILAQDDFERADQHGWGTASDGSFWAGDANRSAVFSIQGDAGQIQGGSGFFDALLGVQRVNEEVDVTATISRFDATNINLGAVLHWVDAGDYYKAYLDGANLILIKSIRGTKTRLAALPFPAQAGVSYTLRFRIIHFRLEVSAWPSLAPAPATWLLIASDKSIAGGFGGLRALVEPGVRIRVSSFQELIA